ncbi:proteophosphoglycan protein [Ceratobasidium sp. AG-Ba]|nr:proteophosphoglycan protein [Ceratobasidium sp. AG-Ba]
MSSSLQLPSGLSITGGIPIKSQDLAPSIIFIVAYVILTPLAVFRIARKESRSTTLIRPTIFIVVRIATYIMRAIQANGNYAEALFIVEQVFLLAGFPIICEAILSLLESHITRTHTSSKQGQITQRVTRLLRIALLVALIIGIVAGTQYSSALSDPSKLDTLRTLRNVNAGLCLAIVVGVIVVVLIAQVHKNLPIHPTILLVFMAGCLVVAGAYRLIMIHTTSPPLSIATKAKFYILLTLMEWLVTATLFAFNIRLLFAEDLAKEKKNAAKRGEQQGQVPYEQVPMGTRSSNQHYKDPYASA